MLAVRTVSHTYGRRERSPGEKGDAPAGERVGRGLVSECRGASSCHVCLTFLTFKGSERQKARLSRLLNKSQHCNAAKSTVRCSSVELVSFVNIDGVFLHACQGRSELKR